MSDNNYDEILRNYTQQQVDDVLKNSHYILIDEQMIPAANCQSGVVAFYVRDALVQQKPPVAATYYRGSDSNGIIVSLQSIGDFDVGEIARKFGGSGHKNSAGFQVQSGCMEFVSEKG
jgi:nanoRNase/pAp phosphatase (c-di-AMP/oligoRNAs hydrolase)